MAAAEGMGLVMASRGKREVDDEVGQRRAAVEGGGAAACSVGLREGNRGVGFIAGERNQGHWIRDQRPEIVGPVGLE